MPAGSPQPGEGSDPAPCLGQTCLMTWSDDTFEHNGHVAIVLFDGTSCATTSSSGPIVTTETDGAARPAGRWVQRTSADVSGWQCRCDCGWRGQNWTRVQDLVDEDRQARSAFADDPSGAAPQWVEDACHPEWAAHAAGLHDSMCPVRGGGGCLCGLIALVRADQDAKRHTADGTG